MGFDRIIGYESIKTELKRYCDALQNPEKYQKLGISMPRGVILHGAPGLGKTTLAKAFTEECGREVFFLRKVKPDGDFINEINDVFEKAKNGSPSIVFLDDMDKFANEDCYHPNAEEYVAVQAGIDGCVDNDVFVIATANSTQEFPNSLLRAGRFDKTIRIETPTGEESAAIIRHYLSRKSIMDDVDVELIERLMDGRSCAELETVINEAGIYAGYAGREKIAGEDFMSACFSMLFNEYQTERPTVRFGYAEEMDEIKERNPYVRDVAVHETGHALVAEMLAPGSVNVVSIMASTGNQAGVTNIRKPKGYNFAIDLLENDIIQSLGGKAAVETVLGKHDLGSSADVRHCINIVKDLMGGYIGPDSPSRNHCSEHFDDRLELRVEAMMEDYYRRARRIIADHRELFDAMVEELMEKKTLTYRDISRIRGEVEDTKDEED